MNLESRSQLKIEYYRKLKLRAEAIEYTCLKWPAKLSKHQQELLKEKYETV